MAAEWKQVLLADLMEFTRDGEWGTDQPGPDTVEMLVVRGTDFARFRLGALADIPRRHVPREAAERKALCAGDVLIETAGGTKDQSTGRTALVKHRHLEGAGVPVTCASFARLLRFKRSEVEPAFMYWWLQHLHSSGEMEVHQVQHTGVARFQFTKFAQTTEAPVPPLPEQRAIAHILSTLDDKIELNWRMSETLEAMARAIFKSWFVDFEPVRAKSLGKDPAVRAEIAEQFPDAFQETALGEIPKTWAPGSLGDILVQRLERCRPSEETASRPYLPIDCIPSKSLLLGESRPGSEAQSSLNRFYRNDLLFGAMRPYFHKVCIAPFDGTTRSTVFVLYPRRARDLGFATFLLHHEDTIDYATRHSTGSTIPYAVWTDSLESMPVAIPPSGIRECFNSIVGSMLEQIHAAHLENRTLAALRDALLPRLLTGALEVSGQRDALSEDF